MKDERQSQSRPPSREGKRTFSVYLKPEALKQLRLLSVQTGHSGQELGEEAINLLFERHRLNRIACAGMSLLLSSFWPRRESAQRVRVSVLSG
jgi:Antitoxin-like ribbon-helix-helix